MQQRTIGTLGVNLIYGAFYDFEDRNSILNSLLDGIGPGRIEIDYIELNGKEIQSDPVENNLSLLRHGLARAVMFDESGAGVAPTEIFHSRPILIERGGYRALNKLDQEYAAAALKLLSKSSSRKEKEPIFVLESTINNLLKVIQPTDAEMVEHTKRLCSTGHPVMISTFSEAYHLTGFLRRFSNEPMAFLMSVAMLMQVFQEERYISLGAGILEACAKLFGDKVHLYAYPIEGEKLSKYLEQNGFDMESYDFPRAGLATVKEIMPKTATRHLYRYLLDQGIIVGV